MENGKALFKTDPGGWIHIAPFGEHPHSCGVIQVIDRRACDGMVSAFEARRAKEGDTFAGVLLDYDHFSMDTDKPSEAAGWITELATRDDGLWGRVRWTDTGLKAVEGGRYRLVSAVFPGVDELEVVDAKLNKRRPLELRSCALTNEPNIKGAKPIANRKGGAGEKEEGGVRKEELGVVVGGNGAARFMWLVGATKSGTHCPECSSRHGKVKTLLEWMRMKPPYCRCQCRLVEIGKDVPEGFKAPPIPPAPVKNRAVAMLMLRDVRGILRNRWSDAARVASVAARLAKYGSMMGLKPWGDSARLAASAARRSSAAPRKSSSSKKPRTGTARRKTSTRDKSNDVCFKCGAKGHWAYDCTAGSSAAPVAEPSSEVLAKRRAAAEQYERVSALPKRLGGYYTDGSPVIMDLARDLAMMARERDRYSGKATLGDAAAYERMRAARDKDMRAWLAGVERVEYGINLFNELTAALGGMAGAAAGAAKPTGVASSAFGAVTSGGGALGRKMPPVIRDFEAVQRLGRIREIQEKDPTSPLRLTYKKKDFVDEDGLTTGQRAEIGIRAKEGLFSAWYQSLKGTPGEGAEAPKTVKELMEIVPKVTGNPKSAEWIYEAAREQVLAKSRRIASQVEVEAAERVALIKEIVKAQPGEYTSRTFKYTPTPMLRQWRDRVAGTGPYSPTGVYSAGTPREAEFKHTAPVDPKHHPQRVKYMLAKIAQLDPGSTVLEGTPPRIIEKLYWRALRRGRAAQGRVAEDAETYVLEKEYPAED